MSARVIAIGDIHGCAAALRALVEAIQPVAEDTIVTLGDCVDRGPESRQVIEELLRLRERCQLVPLLGNHEEMMLNFIDGRPQPDDWLHFGGAETVESYRDEQGKTCPVPKEQLEFIRAWDDFYETPSHFFVHGSYEPEAALTRQHWATLRWHSLKFGVPGPHVSGKTAVVGHTSQKNGKILDVGHLICIDTFCWGGGWLTALEPNTGEIWQANRQGSLRNEAASA